MATPELVSSVQQTVDLTSDDDHNYNVEANQQVGMRDDTSPKLYTQGGKSPLRRKHKHPDVNVNHQDAHAHASLTGLCLSYC